MIFPLQAFQTHSHQPPLSSAELSTRFLQRENPNIQFPNQEAENAVALFSAWAKRSKPGRKPSLLT